MFVSSNRLDYMLPMTSPIAPIVDADPQERLLDAAESLFAEHGYNGVSLRVITTRAGVNIGAANYYFRSKEGLFRAVFARRVGPMSAERQRLLEECVARADGRPPPIEEVLEAFIAPAIRITASPQAEAFKKLSGRISTDPSPEVRRTVYELYDEIAARFVDVLRQACPHLSREDLFWRLACIYGAMMYVRADSGRLQRLLGDNLVMTNSEAALHHIIPFLAAGMRLPPIG
jgi:AcrR family transcriptional regulator